MNECEKNKKWEWAKIKNVHFRKINDKNFVKRKQYYLYSFLSMSN